jgi:hypothetical protein
MGVTQCPSTRHRDASPCVLHPHSREVCQCGQRVGQGPRELISMKPKDAASQWPTTRDAAATTGTRGRRPSFATPHHTMMIHSCTPGVRVPSGSVMAVVASRAPPHAATRREPVQHRNRDTAHGCGLRDITPWPRVPDARQPQEPRTAVPSAQPGWARQGSHSADCWPNRALCDHRTLYARMRQRTACEVHSGCDRTYATHRVPTPPPQCPSPLTLAATGLTATTARSL